MKKQIKITTQTTTVPVGTIMAYTLNNIPDGWLLCDGSKIPDECTELKNIFPNNLTPKLGGRTLVGAGLPENTNSETSPCPPNFDDKKVFELRTYHGEYKHELREAELPKHNHTINKGNFGKSNQSFKIDKKNGDYPYFTTKNNENFICGTDDFGNNIPYLIMQPYFTVKYIIYTGVTSK